MWVLFSKWKKTQTCWIVCSQLGIITGPIHTLFCGGQRAAFSTCYLGSLSPWVKDQTLLRRGHWARFRSRKGKIGLCSLEAVVARWMDREDIYSNLPVSSWEHPDLLMFFGSLVEILQILENCDSFHVNVQNSFSGWNVHWWLPWLPLAHILKCFLNSYIKFFIPEITWNSFCCALQILTDMPIKVPYINGLLFCHIRILEAGLF